MGCKCRARAALKRKTTTHWPATCLCRPRENTNVTLGKVSRWTVRWCPEVPRTALSMNSCRRYIYGQRPPLFSFCFTRITLKHPHLLQSSLDTHLLHAIIPSKQYDAANMRLTTATTVLATFALSATTSLAQEYNQSADFSLLVSAPGSQWDGTTFEACHEGAAIEALCAGATLNTSDSFQLFQFNYTSAQPINATAGLSGYLTYELHGGNFIGEFGSRRKGRGELWSIAVC